MAFPGIGQSMQINSDYMRIKNQCFMEAEEEASHKTSPLKKSELQKTCRKLAEQTFCRLKDQILKKYDDNEGAKRLIEQLYKHDRTMSFLPLIQKLKDLMLH